MKLARRQGERGVGSYNQGVEMVHQTISGVVKHWEDDAVFATIVEAAAEGLIDPGVGIYVIDPSTSEFRRAAFVGRSMRRTNYAEPT